MFFRGRAMIVVSLVCWVIVEKCWAGKLTPARFSIRDQNTLPQRNHLNTRTLMRSKDWVKITESPSAVITSQLGARVELRCEAMGSPAPTIRWMQGLTPISQGGGVYETNSVADNMGMVSGGMAKVRSRLVLDCIMPMHEQPYTCVATAAGQTVVSAPSMLLVEGGSANNLTALLSACPSRKTSPATIIGWSSLLLENIGNDVVLPCKTQGEPRPQVYWLDGDSVLVSNSDPRYKVLPNGSLLIEKLKWQDMGGYTCVATNSHSKDAATTFLYPAELDED